MKKRFLTVVTLAMAFCVFLFQFGFSSCASAPPEENPLQSLVMTACTACHDTQRICDALGKKDGNAWIQTITRMKGKGAAVDQDKIPGLADFLSTLKPGTPPVCK